MVVASARLAAGGVLQLLSAVTRAVTSVDFLGAARATALDYVPRTLRIKVGAIVMGGAL